MVAQLAFLQPHTIEKRCTGPCGRMLPATTEFFYRHRSNEDRLEGKCKACRKAYDHERQSRPEVQEKRRINERKRLMRPEVRERRLTSSRKHHALHREKRNAYCRIHAKGYKATRLARKKAIAGEFTVQQIRDLLKRQKHTCYYCSTKFQRVKGKYIYHIDHTFPLSRVAGTDIPANDISYLVLTCPTCNMRKQNRFPWEFPEGGRLL